MPRPNFRRPRALVVGALLVLDLALVLSGKAGLLAAAITISLAVYGVILLGTRLLRKSHLIWRLRNRLIVTYLLVGAVPIMLILALAFCGAWIVVGQVATYLVSSELRRKAVSLENPARFMTDVPPAQRAALARQMAPILNARNAGFMILISGPEPFHYPENAPMTALPEGWDDFTGIIERQGAYYAMALVKARGTRTAVVAPLDRQAQENLVPGIGTLNINGSEQFAGNLPGPWNMVDFECVWGNAVEAGKWDEPNRMRTLYLTVITRPSAVLRVVFGDHMDFAQGILFWFLIIAATLALVEVVSVVASVSMTRTVTGAVHHLYTGTQRIGAGDFTHRIPARGNDQLAELSQSFNQMTEQLGRLVLVAKEKERLQSELAIASEVQNQLFPRLPPRMRTIELLGACEPARSVSGDYYDYLCLPDGNLAIAVGDVAGKGISAALLMASIQSIMRTQLAGGTPSPGRVVSQLNRQLYESTSPEKYATFFFGLYDEHSRILTYTNAGHLPPLIVRGDDVQPLGVTGTVVGIFPKVEYQQEVVELLPGDLLVAYTDGITEPENAYGEEFGTERLTNAVLRNRACTPHEIVIRVMEAVKQWSHSPELPDDMTVLIARGTA